MRHYTRSPGSYHEARPSAFAKPSTFAKATSDKSARQGGRALPSSYAKASAFAKAMADKLEDAPEQTQSKSQQALVLCLDKIKGQAWLAAMRLGHLFVGIIALLLAGCEGGQTFSSEDFVDLKIVNRSQLEVKNASANFGKFDMDLGKVPPGAEGSGGGVNPDLITGSAELQWDEAGTHRVEKIYLWKIYPKGKPGTLIFTIYDGRAEARFEARIDESFQLPEWVGDAVDMALELAGIWMLWRYVLCPAARAKWSPPQIAAWPVGWIALIVLVVGALVAGVVGAVAALFLCRPRSDNGELLVVMIGFDLATIAWCQFVRKRVREGRGLAPTIRLRTALAGGAATFLIMCAIGHAVYLVWTSAMQLAGLQPESQDLTLMAEKIASPVERVQFALDVAVMTPVIEELVFRGALYPFARARLPRWGALLLPACLWAASHGSLTAFVPIMVFGVIMSLAYERTGNLAVPMVAHGLHNLLWLAGVWYFG